jgi:hypothetical protein
MPTNENDVSTETRLTPTVEQRNQFDGDVADVTDNQGWTDQTLLDLALGFIASRQDHREFVAHLNAVAEDENGNEDY